MTDKIAVCPHIKKLSGADFDSKTPWLLKSKKCSLVAFYSETCPHCIAMQDEYCKFAQKCKFMDVCGYNRNDNREHYELIHTDNPSFITGVPTFVFYKNGKYVSHFEGERNVADFLTTSMQVCEGK